MIIKIIYFLILSIVIGGCSTNTKKLSTIHRLDSAANFLMLVSDEEKGITNNCNISSQEAIEMLQPLHAMIDDEIKKQVDQVDENQMIACQKFCHCGIYSDLTSNDGDKKKLIDDAKSTSRKKLIECANASAKWLCNSVLFKKLKSEMEPKNNAL